MAHDQHRRHAVAEIVLRDERVEHFGLDRRHRVTARAAGFFRGQVGQYIGGRIGRLRQLGLVADPPSASVSALSTCVGKYALSPRCRPPRTIARFTHAPALRDDEPGCRRRCRCRPRSPAGAAPSRASHLVAHGRRLLEFQFGRERVHLLLELLHHFGLPAEQETRGIRYVDRVILVGDRADARRRAAPDLVQQARSRAVVEDRILAGAQLEHALQDLDALAHGRHSGTARNTGSACRPSRGSRPSAENGAR